jgi:proteasome lid subunit RPN8/RPN11
MRAPNEACGVLLPEPGDTSRRVGIGARVIELPNRSMSPGDSYELQGSDIVIELEEWLQTAGRPAVNSLAIWHTHPGGGIGPSLGDLAHKLDDLSYLVVSIDPLTGMHQTTLF